MKLTGFNDPMYGPIAFGTSGRAPNLTGWPGGGYIGIHGTNRPELLPGAVSHGCIRLKNGDIVRLVPADAGRNAGHGDLSRGPASRRNPRSILAPGSWGNRELTRVRPARS